MKVVSAAAIIGQHCLNKNVASGRPDEQDNIKILEYANKIYEKVKSIEDIVGVEKISIKGNYPYHPLKASHTPKGDSKCIQCGVCAEGCPTRAIDKLDYRKTDSNLCIFCGHCINICPTDSRNIKEESFLDFMKKLELITSERREIEVFID